MEEMHIGQLREHEIEALTSAYEAVAREGSGQLIFLAGDDTLGRTDVLHGCAERLRSVTPRPAVLGGSFHDGLYVPWEQDSAAVDAALARLTPLLSLGEAAVTLGGFLLPAAVTQLLSQILSKSKAALEIAAASISDQPKPGDSQLLPRVLRRLCEERPTVCFIDVGDGTAQGLWADLAALFARRVAHDLPLLLVFALDGPKEPGPHEAGEPDVLNVARQLTSEKAGIASWRWLPPIAPKELERWTGRADRDVIRSVLDITGGRGGWTAELWRDWRRRGVIEDLTDGKWRFAASGRRRRLDDVDDSFNERLRHKHDDKLGPIARAESVLACGALEGQRFTAPAVAEALEEDPDAVIDFIDDFLLDDGPDSDGFLIEDGFTAIADERGRRDLAMYRFAKQLDWLALRDHGLGAGERQHLSRRLADALQFHYGGQARRVAPALSRLYEQCGSVDQATHYRQMADQGVTRDLLLWRASNSLEADAPTDRAEKARRCRLLIAASNELVDAGPFAEGLRFGQAAQQLAERPIDHATACALCADHLLHLGSHAEARREWEKARGMFASLRKIEGEQLSRYALAFISLAEGEFDQAKTELDELLSLTTARRNPRIRGMTQRAIAYVALGQGRFTDARREAIASSQIFEQLDDPWWQALTVQCIGEIDIKQGHYEDGRRRLKEAISTYRRMHRLYAEAVARLFLADACRRLDDYPEARREFEAVLGLQAKLGDKRGQADAHLGLGLVEGLAGNDERGLSHLNTALCLARERGDRYSEALALHNLFIFDSTNGEGGGGFDAETVLSQHRAMGNREGEARVRLHLAGRHGAAGRLDLARSEIDAVLRICSEEGDRHLEAHARYRGGMIGLSESDLASARRDLQAAFDLYVDIGDQTGEELSRTALEGLDRRSPGPIVI